MRHAFTVDVEDWYQGIPVSAGTKASAERRLDKGLDAILEALEGAGVKGTFFLLGPVAEEHGDSVRRIAKGGHELGCHGWSHDLLYTMTPERFRDETKRAADTISQLTGAPVTSYRAAYFSVTKKSLWALDELAGLGFKYDSSIFPVKNWRYGIPDFEPGPQKLETKNGPIYEFPISVRRFLGHNLPISGGAYFRLYPYFVTRANFRAMENQGKPVVFYLHPWELDPEHPRVEFSWKARLTHYVNLKSTAGKLKRLLRNFQFTTLGEVLDSEFKTTRS